ncbi:hypothetical protein [Actinophytocola sp.]|uniref:hypothetical protein n=1 Tax=Actinophytocola sp. TaxID=1872138 RepID=UPI002ECFF88C
MKWSTAGRTIAAIAALTLALTATAANAQPQTKGRTDPGVTALRTCDGGVQRQSLVTTQNTPTTIEESSVATALPGAQRTFTTSEEEQVRVTFAAEAILIGAAFDTEPAADSIGVEIRIDGLVLPGTGDLAFASGTFGSNATLVCARIPAGEHTVQVFWQVFDTSSNDVLQGRFDDWALDIQINN